MQPVVAVSANMPSTTEPQFPQGISTAIPYRNGPLPNTDESQANQAVIPEFATPTQGYSIAELQQMALQSNPALMKKQREIQAKYGTWLQVGLYANPTVGFLGEDYADNGTQGRQGLVLEQEIIRGNKLGVARNVERWSIEIARKEWEIAQVKVVNDVKAYAYDYMLAVHLVEAHRSLVEIAEKNLGFTEELVKRYELGKTELLQNRILKNRTSVELAKAEQNEQEKWAQLVAMVGRPDLPKQGITDPVRHACFDLVAEELWQRLAVGSPEVQLEQLRRQKANCVIRQEEAQAVSNITVGGTFGYHVSDKAMSGDIGFTMPLRVYDRNQGNIRRAQADAMAQTCEIERVQLDLRTRFAAEWNSYLNARTVMNQYESIILPDAEESIVLVRGGVQQGELSSLELLIAQQTYFQTRIEYINAVRDVVVGGTYLNGMLLKGGLGAP